MCMTTAVAHPSTAENVWVRRVRFAGATAIAWAAFHWVGGVILPAGFERAPVLIAGPMGFGGGLLVTLLICLAAGAARLVVGPDIGRRPLMAVALGLALWAAEGGRLGGTMDDWLIHVNEEVAAPVGTPYWQLLPDYLLLIVGFGGAWLVVRRLGGTPRSGSAVVNAKPASPGPVSLKDGLTALVTTTLVGALAIHLLTGPADYWTYRGQVYFAVGVGFLLASYAGRWTAKVYDPLWYLPAPFVVGLLGVVVAGMRPEFSLSSAYGQINSLPAWALVRALPIEMVGMGLVGVLLKLRAPDDPSASTA